MPAFLLFCFSRKRAAEPFARIRFSEYNESTRFTLTPGSPRSFFGAALLWVSIQTREALTLISIAVVDDEKSFSDQLTGFIQRYAKEQNLDVQVTVFQDGMEIADDFRSKWDIIFLDIQMQLLDGLSTARRIRACDQDVIIIFVTTMAQYAINGYEVDAFDYVLKPLEYPQFTLRMAKAVREVEKKKAHAHIMLKKWSDWVKVSTDDILYIEVSGHTLRYVTVNETYEKRATIGDAEKELEGLPFSRCSLSFLVNLKRIDRISKDTVILGSHQLSISRNRKKEFLQAFTDYLEATY